MIDKLTRLVEVFNKSAVKYLFIGKGAAILYGYPGTTQDIDIFPKKTKENCSNLVGSMKELGFAMDKPLEDAILAGKDFIQIRGGPFPLDIVFAPDGIDHLLKLRSVRRSSMIDSPVLQLRILSKAKEPPRDRGIGKNFHA